MLRDDFLKLMNLTLYEPIVPEADDDVQRYRDKQLATLDELIALDHRIQEFKDRHVEVIGVSIDSQFTHNAYRNTPVKQGGIGPVKFTLAADVTHSICQSYGVEHPVAGVALRGAFIIDKNGLVRSQIVNDLPIGRNVDELLRVIDAVQFFEENGEVCPAGCHKGKAGMKASPKGVADYLSNHSEEL